MTFDLSLSESAGSRSFRLSFPCNKFAWTYQNIRTSFFQVNPANPPKPPELQPILQSESGKENNLHNSDRFDGKI